MSSPTTETMPRLYRKGHFVGVVLLIALAPSIMTGQDAVAQIRIGSSCSEAQQLIAQPAQLFDTIRGNMLAVCVAPVSIGAVDGLLVLHLNSDMTIREFAWRRREGSGYSPTILRDFDAWREWKRLTEYQFAELRSHLERELGPADRYELVEAQNTRPGRPARPGFAWTSQGARLTLEHVDGTAVFSGIGTAQH